MKKLLPVVAMFVFVLVMGGCSQQGGASSQGASSAGAPPAASQAPSAPSAANPDAKTYTIARISGEPSWGSIAQLGIDDAEWGDSFGISAHAQLCHDDQAIYVRMWAEEQDVRATYAADDPSAKPYEDSCLEAFIMPVAGDARYLNFEFNPNCALCNEVGVQKQGRTRLLPDAETLGATSARTPDGWEITYRIPYDYLRTLYPAFSPEPGMQLRGNFYKCGNLTANKHYLVWSHVNSDTPNFHAPDSFGTLVLE